MTFGCKTENSSNSSENLINGNKIAQEGLKEIGRLILESGKDPKKN